MGEVGTMGQQPPKQYGCGSLLIGLMALAGAWWYFAGPPRAPVAEPAAAVATDAVGGLDRTTRREIYRAYYHKGMDATAAAEARYPFDGMPTDAADNRAYLAARKALYDTAKAAGRRAILGRYEIDGAQLDAIEREGFANKWPLDPRP